jgi:hypothetical protein
MAITNAGIEWFDRPDRMDEVVYGILDCKDRYLVFKKEFSGKYSNGIVDVLTEADSRQAAIGFIKLLVEK